MFLGYWSEWAVSFLQSFVWRNRMFFSLLRVLFILRFFLSWFAFVCFCLAAFFVAVRCCRRLCARKFPFMRKSAAVLAQGLRSLCAGPCVLRCHPCGRGGMPAAPCRGDSGVPRCRSCGCGAVAAVPWRGFPPAVSRPRAVSAGELLPAVRGCPRVLLLPSGKNAVA